MWKIALKSTLAKKRRLFGTALSVMIGVAFYGLNKLFAHLGLLNTWPPIIVAALPSLVVLATAMSALYWIERR